MRAILVLLVVCGGILRADFRYDSEIRITGGSLADQAGRRSNRKLREPVTTENLLKGNRMAILSKNRTVVLDLDHATMTEIDYREKTYLSTTFAQMIQAHKSAGGPFTISLQPTGRTKAIDVLNAREVGVNITGPGDLKASAGCWVVTIPGFVEVQDFYKKLDEKLGFAYDPGLQRIAAEAPAALAGALEAIARGMNQLQGAPAKAEIRIESGQGTLLLSGGDSGFTAAPADESKFIVPTGFKPAKPAK